VKFEYPDKFIFDITFKNGTRDHFVYIRSGLTNVKDHEWNLSRIEAIEKFEKLLNS
jgi:hypothetical protein